MKKVKCYSVRLKSLRSISSKAYMAQDFAGNEAILPKSAVFNQDQEVSSSEAFWLAAWILEVKNLQYSTKKAGWYNPTTFQIEPHFETVVEKHVPEKSEALPSQPLNNLLK